MQECCKKCITELLDSLAKVLGFVKKMSEIYYAVHGIGQPTYRLDQMTFGLVLAIKNQTSSFLV